MFTAEVRPSQALEYLQNLKHLNLNVRSGRYFIDNNVVKIHFKLSHSQKSKPNNSNYQMKLRMRYKATKPYEMLTLLPDLSCWEQCSEYIVLDTSVPFLFHLESSFNPRSQGPLL